MLYYKEFNPAGAKAVVLLHGLGANCDSWQYQWDEFARAGYRVIVPDLTGFGRSAYARGPVSVKTLSDDLYKFMRQINLQRAHFVGLSMGGAVAMQFVLDHPVIVEKLVLSNTAARFLARGKKMYFLSRFIVARLVSPKTRARFIANYTFPKPEFEEIRDEYIRQFLSANQRAYMRLAASFAKYDLKERIHQIKVPTLIIGGREDRTLPVYMQEFLHERIKGSKLVVFEGGHVSSIDNAEEFNREVLDFLAENS